MSQINDPSSVQRCLAIENNETAFECLKDVIRASEAACRPQLVLVTQEGCPYCEVEKETRAQDIAQGLVQLVDINSLRGKAIARANGVDFIPSMLILDCNDNPIPSV